MQGAGLNKLRTTLEILAGFRAICVDGVGGFAYIPGGSQSAWGDWASLFVLVVLPKERRSDVHRLAWRFGMRRRLIGLVLATAVVAGFSPTQATEQRKTGTLSAHPGIVSVTDSKGNPIALRDSAAGTTNPSAVRQPVQEVQRGQTWWPYASSLPPYTGVMKRAEAMSETEIQVNGVALLDTRDVEATLRLIPQPLRLAEGSQLAQSDGFYLVKIGGFTRTQEQLDALTRAGATLGEYLNINTYVAKIPTGSVAAVKALPFVTYVGDYQPAYKISPRIGLDDIPLDEAVDTVTGEPKPWLFEVVLHKGVYVTDVLNDMARLGIFPETSDIVSNDALTVVLVRTAPDAVPALSLIPGVKWIAEKAYPHLLASATNPATIPMVLQNNGVYTTNSATGWKLWNAGIDGRATSQIVTMMDSGLKAAPDLVCNRVLVPTRVAGVDGPDNFGLVPR